jgi:hypothetical protein
MMLIPDFKFTDNTDKSCSRVTWSPYHCYNFFVLFSLGKEYHSAASINKQRAINYVLATIFKAKMGTPVFRCCRHQPVNEYEYRRN